jgi:hypothetical protein
MAKIVKADLRDPRQLEQRLEGAVAKVLGVDEGAACGGEDEAAGLLATHRGS